jgi:hypothetical protein
MEVCDMNYIKLSHSTILIGLSIVYGIYRDHRPKEERDGIIRHWVKLKDEEGKLHKTLIVGITHPEYAVIKSASNYNQVRETYVSQGKVSVIG